ncbi:FAD dependent oxidoreductase [Gloeophyllum trabeum ATCC 11539]|uniref:FAD dependent oxidoreductase n=1 Tax=Gloeophyllum trabeum (strain ATCC 11539 / FP-39264 / Madison 617) TaxID=670483 RepID=S7QA23_GLOTA|nr:FAD dependent oxidoreductase [Gloeophyllum trabeum ATCC 11539]EPQ56208.1 FAD dependent oxidoreductase [Gloeophyllum trabeum ATCC 11539]
MAHWFPFPFNELAGAQKALLELEAQDDARADLPVPNPTKSFWLDSTPGVNPLAKEGSEGALTTDADVCIVGSGITGVSTAYHLSRLLQGSTNGPLRVVILEARDFCSGATGRNGGHLTSRAFVEFSDFEKLYGREEAIKSIAIEDYTVRRLVELIKADDVANDVDLISSEHVHLAFTNEELAYGKADFAAAKAAGLNLDHVQWMDAEEMQAKYGAAYPGVKWPGNNVWPLKLVTHLFQSSQKDESKLSMNLHTHTPVTAVSARSPESSDPFARRWSVRTARGTISCGYVVHATNAYASYLLPHLHGPRGIIPARGQIIAVRADVSAEELTKTSYGGNQGFEYWFPMPAKLSEGKTDQPLVIMGGGREATGPRYETYTTDDSTLNPVVGKGLREFLPHVFPTKYAKGREPEMEWSGIMGFTAIGDPFVGPIGERFEGQYISAGYSGHGMPRAFSCAEVVAQMIVASLLGSEWAPPEWLPKRYLTWEKR